MMNDPQMLARMQGYGGAQAAPQGAMGGGPMGQGGSISPELLQAILAMQQQNAQQAQVDRSRRQADMLRADAGGQMQGHMIGPKDRRVYVPPNLANLAANVYGGYKAKQMDDDADVRQRNMGVQRQDTLRRFFEALQGYRGQQMLPHMGDQGE
jgi:hypothetical protein